MMKQPFHPRITHLMVALFAAAAIVLIGGMFGPSADADDEINPYPETKEGIAAYRKHLVQKQHDRLVYPTVVTEISSLDELAEYAGKSGVHVRMKPGVYEVTVDNVDELLGTTTGGPSIIKKGRKPATDRTPTIKEGGVKPYIFNFSGTHSYFDLRGVTLKIHTRAAATYKKELGLDGRILLSEVLVTGDNLIIEGLTVTDVGNHPNPNVSARTVQVTGHKNLFQDLNITSRGSRPYGYGSLVLFWGGGNRDFPIRKKSTLGAGGLDNVYVDCEIYTKTIGHAVMFNRNNSNTFIHCHVEAGKRTTGDMLNDTSGPLYENDFVTQTKYGPSWRSGKLKAGHVVSLSEDAFRAYWSYNTYKGKASGEFKALGCRVVNTRGAFVLRYKEYSPAFFSHCTTVGINWQGTYRIGGSEEVKIVNGRTDLRYGDFLRILSGEDYHIGMTVLPTDAESLPEGRLALINGRGHDIFLRAEKDLGLQDVEGVPPIVVGGEQITLRNQTGLPVKLTGETRQCQIITNGDVTDNGENNQIKHVD